LFGIKRQVYYRAVARINQRQQLTAQVLRLIEHVRIKMPRIGTRKLYYLLEDQMRELGVGRDRLFAIMKANHLQIVPRRQYHITTDSHHRFRKHKNLVESMIPQRPEQIWVSDITYLGTRTNPMYLSLVTDAYSKRIMGFNVSQSLNASGALAALKSAIKNRRYSKQTLIHHSDRGLQYCCDDYQEELTNNQIACSMTEKYDPYQNAIAERVNGILKQEFIRGITTNEVELMTKLVKQAVDRYNNERPHWSCMMKTPNFMHQQRKIKIRTYKKKNSTMLVHSAI